LLLFPSPSLVLPLPLGGGGYRWGRVSFSSSPSFLPKSSPSLWEGEDIGGGGSTYPNNFRKLFFHFVTELIG